MREGLAITAYNNSFLSCPAKLSTSAFATADASLLGRDFFEDLGFLPASSLNKSTVFTKIYQELFLYRHTKPPA